MADAVIIGGGITGVSIAFHLAGLGMRRVVALERRLLASGGTGRSGGIVRQLYPTPETSAMVLRSLRVFQRFSDVVGGDAGYVASGVLIAVSPAMRPKLEADRVPGSRPRFCFREPDGGTAGGLARPVPQATRFGVLWNRSTPSHQPAVPAIEAAGEKLGVALYIVPARYFL